MGSPLDFVETEDVVGKLAQPHVRQRQRPVAFFFLRSSISFLREERRITLGNQRPGEKFRLFHSRIVERMASGIHMPLDKVQQDR